MNLLIKVVQLYYIYGHLGIDAVILSHPLLVVENKPFVKVCVEHERPV